MAINTTNLAQIGEITIDRGRANQFTGVFAGIGNIAGINVGGFTTGTGGTGGTGTGPAIVIAEGAGTGGADVVAFDTMLEEVRPGDLITSNFMARLLRRINVLEAAVLKLASGGDVVVPDLFGQQLSKVVTAVKRSAGKLKFGLVLDVTGVKIDPERADDGTRLVLGQHPAPGDEVDEGTELNLLVSILPRRGEQPTSGVGGAGGFNVVAVDRAVSGAAAGELERVTDETSQPAAGAAPKATTKGRKSPTK